MEAIAHCQNWPNFRFLLFRRYDVIQKFKRPITWCQIVAKCPNRIQIVSFMCRFGEVLSEWVSTECDYDLSFAIRKQINFVCENTRTMHAHTRTHTHNDDTSTDTDTRIRIAFTTNSININLPWLCRCTDPLNTIKSRSVIFILNSMLFQRVGQPNQN